MFWGKQAYQVLTTTSPHCSSFFSLIKFTVLRIHRNSTLLSPPTTHCTQHDDFDNPKKRDVRCFGIIALKMLLCGEMVNRFDTGAKQIYIYIYTTDVYDSHICTQHTTHQVRKRRSYTSLFYHTYCHTSHTPQATTY